MYITYKSVISDNSCSTMGTRVFLGPSWSLLAVVPRSGRNHPRVTVVHVGALGLYWAKGKSREGGGKLMLLPLCSQ